MARLFWITISLGIGAFWGGLLWMLTGSLPAALVLGVISSLVGLFVGGLCMGAGSYNDYG